MNDGFSLEDRILCCDGACIGLVGADGHCKECGKEYEGDATLPSAQTDDIQKPVVDVEPLPSIDSNDSDPNERVCCSDDSCIGVVGADGKCGTCGKSV